MGGKCDKDSDLLIFSWLLVELNREEADYS